MCGGADPFRIFGMPVFGNEISQQAAYGTQGNSAMALQLVGLQGQQYSALPLSPPTQSPAKMVCSYCGGPPYTERSCPGCGARGDMKRRTYAIH